MLTLADLGVLRDVRVDGAARRRRRSPRPTPAARRWATCAPTCVHALHRRRASPTSTCAPSLAPPGPPTGSARRAAASSPRRHRAARHGAGPRPRPDPAAARPDPPDAPARSAARTDTEEPPEFGATACKALRRCRACARAVRARQGDLMTPRTTAPTAFHPLTRRGGRAAHRRRRRRHLRHPRRAADDYAFTPGQSLTLRRSATARRAPVVLDLRADGRPPRVGVREVPGGFVSGWLVHRSGPATPSRCCRRPARSPPTCRCRSTTSSSPPGRASPRCCPWPPRCCGDAGRPRPRVLYGNRRTNTVMFADELADLKDRLPGPAAAGARALPRAAGRRADQRPARRRAAAHAGRQPVDAGRVDHWWLCGPHGMVADAIERADRARRDRRRCTRSCSTSTTSPPEPVRGDEETVTGPEQPGDPRARRPAQTLAAPPRHAGARLGPEGARRPAVRLQGRGLRHLPGAATDGEVRMRRNYALEPDEVDGRLRADLPDAAGLRRRDRRLRRLTDVKIV